MPVLLLRYASISKSLGLVRSKYGKPATYDNFEQVICESDAKENKTMRTFSRLGKVVSVQFHHAELEETEPCLLNANFAADGLPLSKTYNNGVLTTYTYDDLSRRLTREQSFRKAAAGRHEVVQDLSHVYDRVGRRIELKMRLSKRSTSEDAQLARNGSTATMPLATSQRRGVVGNSLQGERDEEEEMFALRLPTR